jgi:hypothetical protein
MDVDPLEVRMVRAAKNQSLCREVNERIEGLAESFAVELSRRDFICECASMTCSEAIRMTVSEYESLRADPACFAVRPSHVIPDVEDVVAQDERFWTVRKRGAAAVLAEKLDPRSQQDAGDGAAGD